MNRPYASPRAFEQAMKSRLTTFAKLNRLAPDLVFRSFYFNRLAARVFHHDPDGWLIKGGQALLLRYPAGARLSRDIDLQRTAAEGVRQAATVLNAAAALDLGDFFTFSPTSVVEHSDEIGGAKLAFDVNLGIRALDTIKVDLVVGRSPTDTPERVLLAPNVDMPWPNDWPLVQLYPLADHIADKICAMYERHRGAVSTRFRDLADLLLISQRESLDGAGVRVALASEVKRRTALGTDLVVPEQFAVPDPVSWATGYPMAAALVLGLQGCLSLADATRAADTFITPILARTPIGRWDPRMASWSSP